MAYIATIGSLGSGEPLIEINPIARHNSAAIIQVIGVGKNSVDVLGMSYNSPGIDANGAATPRTIWSANISNDGKYSSLTELNFFENDVIQDAFGYDSIGAKSSNETFAFLSWTGNNNIYQITEVSKSKPDKALKTLRIGLPQNYKFGNMGSGSGGLYLTNGSVYLGGLSTDSKSIIALKVKDDGTTEVVAEHKSTRSLKIISIDGDGFFFTSSLANKFYSADSRLESINLRKKTEAKPIGQGGQVVIIKNGDGFIAAVNQSAVFPANNYVVYKITPTLDWDQSQTLSEGPLSAPIPLAFTAASAQSPLLGCISSYGSISLWEMNKDSNGLFFKTAAVGPLKSPTRAMFMKGVIPGRPPAVLLNGFVDGPNKTTLSVISLISMDSNHSGK